MNMVEFIMDFPGALIIYSHIYDRGVASHFFPFKIEQEHACQLRITAEEKNRILCITQNCQLISIPRKSAVRK